MRQAFWFCAGWVLGLVVLLMLLLASGCATVKPREHPAPPSLADILGMMGLEEGGIPGLPTPDDAPVPAWFTEETVLFTMGDKGWEAERILVRGLTGQHVHTCFQFKEKRRVDCFYIDGKGHVDFQETWAIGRERT
ncbi:MAG: hypothetical protein ACHQ9S_18770 [Candidatus Binatia bacterium]